MGATCCKGFGGKFRQNRVFPVDQSSFSTSASTVISCTRVSTKSDILMARTAEEIHCQSALRCTEALDMYIEEYTEEFASSNRMQDNRASRLRPNAARGRRQPQSNVDWSCIQLDNAIDILLADPNSKDLEFQRPKAAMGSKRRPTPYCIVLYYQEKFSLVMIVYTPGRSANKNLINIHILFNDICFYVFVLIFYVAQINMFYKIHLVLKVLLY